MVNMHPTLAPLYKGKEDLYPVALEAKYSRVFNNIMKHWGTGKGDEIFADLLLDKRGGRKGFPPDVASDIAKLSRVHTRLLDVQAAKMATGGDPWKNEHVRQQLAKEQTEYSMEGFVHAVELGNERAVKIFLKIGVKPDERDKLGGTPLIKAAMLNRKALVALLLEAGADSSGKNAQGLTPLHWAAFKGYADIAEMLLNKGAEVGAKGGPGVTPLMQAAMNGHAAVCSLLVAKGANVNEPDNEGMTALHKAVNDGHAEVVKILVAGGGDPNAKSASGATPLSIAEKKKRPEVFAALRG
jgi:ankyrin repeat protein